VQHVVDYFVKSDPTFDFKIIQIPNCLFGNYVEFVTSKQTIAALLVKRCPSPIFSRSVDLLGFFVVQWLIEERCTAGSREAEVPKHLFAAVLRRVRHEGHRIRIGRIAARCASSLKRCGRCLSLIFFTLRQFTRRVGSLALKTPHEYVVLPEPKGLRCLLFVERCKVQRISESSDIASIRVELPFDFSLLEGYI
jgi:hypothetical protein